MKKNIIILGAVLLSGVFYSQVGVNTDLPKSTFEVSAKRAANGTITDNTQIIGLQAPRVTRAELTANTVTYGADQKGALIYVTDISGGTTAGSRANMDAPGYYYFDGSLWIKVGSGTEPWNVQGGTTPATSNTQDIYQTGKVAINTSVTNKQLEVKGDMKASYTTGGEYNNLDTSYEISGIKGNLLAISNQPDPLASSEYSVMSVFPGDASFSVKTATAESSIGSNDGKSEVYAKDIGNNIQNRIVAGTDGGDAIGNVMMSSEDLTTNASSKVIVDKLNGVKFKFGIAGNNYTFPKVNGSVNQVLTTDGNPSDAILSWKDASTLAQEPWQIQGTTNPATTNAQNIYQNGSVAIGIASGASIPSTEVTATNPKLYVAGNVSSTGSYYTVTGKYADYVFEDYFDGKSEIDENYKFKTLKEVADYIKANKHLPGVTAIADIAKTKNGYNVNLSELSIQQLEKIEELYLHTIEQQEEISKQKTEINALQSRVEKLEQLLMKETDNK